MGRFRGAEITGEIVDNRQEHMNAFAMVREGMAFLERTMPLGARFPEGQIFREDRFPVPLDALREILLNAVMHRDYSHYSGYVAIVVFDDRIEIRSYGRLPTGITVEQLSGRHDSKPTNPLIAGAFHRTGAVEVWGRGTNRVIAMCREAGLSPPTFEEITGAAVVTFKVNVLGPGRETRQVTPHATPQVSAPSLSQVCPKSVPREIAKRLLHATESSADLQTLMKEAGHTNRTRFRNAVLQPLIEAGLIAPTIPDKPRSSKQKYRLMPAGRDALAVEGQK